MTVFSGNMSGIRKSSGVFFRLVRWPNLLIIILTQYLVRHCLFMPFYSNSGLQPAFPESWFALLVLSTVLIAAGGYVINDLYDQTSDRMNRSGRMTIGIHITPEAARWLYLALSLGGIIAGGALAVRVRDLAIGLIFPGIVILLWFYSSHYKRVYLLGNVVISLLSAMVIMICWVLEFYALRSDPMLFASVAPRFRNLTMLSSGYAMFAFIISMVREVIKDIEDVRGDAAAGYQTLPVVSGITPARCLAVVMTLLIMLMATGALMYFFGHDLMVLFWYFTLVILPFLIFLLIRIIRAKSRDDFHYAGNIAKVIMVAGVLSMQLFSII
ncbi:MAG: geranylgeranylglycerol-phosphate geranylgeranyltransferase [Bacteroidales bacterium]|nr:geranylgeranylglycerol-phosphate geranylgeranyltransferase [Bacteroidales bacterium]